MKRQNKKSTISFISLIVLMVFSVSCLLISVQADGNDAVISLRIEGDFECIYFADVSTKSGVSIKEMLIDVNSTAKLDIVGLETDYITSVKGVSSGKFGGWDGWLYTVNGVSGAVSISEYKLKDGDIVVLYYGDPFGVGFQYPEVEINGDKLSVYSMDTEYDASYNATVKRNSVVGADISVFDASGKEYKYVTDSEGNIALDSDLLKAGRYTYSIQKYANNGLPLVLRPASNASYEIAKNPNTSDGSVAVMLFAFIVFSAVICIRRKKAR